VLAGSVLAAAFVSSLPNMSERTPPPGAAAEHVTVVGEAIMAPNGFQLAAAPRAAAVVNAGCRDTARVLAAWRLPSTFRWYYNPRHAPAPVAATALTALRNGTWTVFHANYRCGGTTSLATAERYVGTSARAAQVSSTGACTGNDNVSVASWGRLPSSMLAYTCIYYRTGTKQILASDVLIDNKIHKWFTTKPASCSNMFDLLAVVVHERGHTVGLDHVDQTAHKVATMSPRTLACDTSERTLSAGDLAGLVARYGTS
jgi:hypothetical protein